jgi:hypothetical protein
MSTDYAEKERDFIAGLDEDTGRDLAGWMALISGTGLGERNAIIDWLRHQGFQFAKASWLERIHHNGGRLIYAETGGANVRRIRIHAGKPDDEPPSRDPRPSRPASPPKAGPADDRDIQTLLATAKGLRPLAEHILDEVSRVVPGVGFKSEHALVVMSVLAPFGALAPGPRMLRLYADFGPDGARRAKPAEAINKAKPPFPEMLLLDDARAIDEEFRRLIRTAAMR